MWLVAKATILSKTFRIYLPFMSAITCNWSFFTIFKQTFRSLSAYRATLSHSHEIIFPIWPLLYITVFLVPLRVFNFKILQLLRIEIPVGLRCRLSDPCNKKQVLQPCRPVRAYIGEKNGDFFNNQYRLCLTFIHESNSPVLHPLPLNQLPST